MPNALPFSSGTRLGPYEITGPLDSGGMGDVYRARDPRLGRDVAIKVLRAPDLGDPDRLRRFEDEARAAGALGHPNILVVHDVGQHGDVPYIVTELLEGRTLQQHLTETGPRSPRAALEWAAQIARGLAAAHEKGIIHRDLKPRNLFVTTDGRVKILDFGLAKLTQPAGDEALTVTSAGRTGSGVVLGTVGYMAPEQVRAQPAGPRADIFALGIVLYEMLAGVSPFARETSAETLTAILKDDAPSLPASVPPALDRIVRRCLEKRPEDRFHSAHDLSLALEVAAVTATPGSTVGEPTHPVESRPGHRSRWSGRLAWSGVGAAVAVLVLGAADWLRPGRIEPTEPIHMTALLPPGVSVASGPGVHLPLAISPDGRTVIVAGAGEKGHQLYERTTGRLEAVPLAGTEGGLAPFFSPDGQWIGFFADRRLKRVPAGGGAAVAITDAPGFPAGASWGPDGRIVFAAGARSPLWVVDAQGGTAEQVTTPDPNSGHLFPEFLPGGRTVLFSENESIYAIDLETRNLTAVVEGVAARYVADGYLIVSRGTTLFAAPFDPTRLELTGELVPVVEGVGVQRTTVGLAHMAVSRTGTLAYVTVPRAYALARVAPDGSDRVLEEGQLFENPRFSPDGRRIVVAVTRREGEGADLWIYDLERPGAPSRLTFDGGRAPVWTPGGTTVTYSHLPREERGIYVRPADGGGSSLVVRVPTFHWLVGWTADGTTLAYGQMEETPPDGIARSSILAFRDGQASRVVGPSQTWGGRLSPDGRWLAYYSSDSGYFETYVTPFPDGGTRWLIAEGTDPNWSPDGSEVYYRSGNRLMAVRLDRTAGFRVVAERVVVEPFSPPRYDDYDIHPKDGRTIVLVRPAGDAQGREVNLILNWSAELRRAAGR